MGQKDGEKWTAAVDLQPTLPKSDSLLGVACGVWRVACGVWRVANHLTDRKVIALKTLHNLDS